MIIDDEQKAHKNKKQQIIRLMLGVIVTAIALYFLGRNVNIAQVGDALRQARPLPILAGVLLIILTNIAKAWRWRDLFVTNKPRLHTSFWALQLNQFLNIVLPGLRVGELARVHTAHEKDGVGRARALGTIVVEKSLELLFLALTMLILLPWMTLPTNLMNTTVATVTMIVVILSALYILAFQTQFTIRLVTIVAGWLPVLLGEKLIGITRSGLDGLAALRDSKTVVKQLTISAIITTLSLATPWILFSAFDLPFGWTAAMLINFGTYLAIQPPSIIPGKFVVFEATVTWILLWLSPSTDEPFLLSYALIYHLVTMIPPVILGGIAAVRSDWGWKKESMKDEV